MTTVNGKSVILIVGGTTISNRLFANVGTRGHCDHNSDDRRYAVYAPDPVIERPINNNKPWYQQSKGRRRSY